jgi:hypothetical protein
MDIRRGLEGPALVFAGSKHPGEDMPPPFLPSKYINTILYNKTYRKTNNGGFIIFCIGTNY